jgi:hypothetical protein
MKYRSFLYIIAIALAILITALTLQTSPAAAASETIKLNPEEVRIAAPL